jgi:hypothetical protein
MRFIDRFTLDDVSAKVWWPFAMVLLVLFVLTFPGEHRAMDARRQAPADADAALTARVIAPAITTAPTEPITGTLAATLDKEVHDEILVNDPKIRAVRIWSVEDHSLLWSTTGERLGVAQDLNDADIDAGAAAGGAGVPVTTDRAPNNGPSPTLSYAYVQVGGLPVVAQFDSLDSVLTSDVRAAWLWYQVVLGVGFLLALALSLLSMREPTARIGTGVPFYPESVPASLAVIEADRVVEIEHVGDRVKDRVAALQQKLDESEAARRRAEGHLQQALAMLAIHGYRLPTSPKTVAGVAPPTIRIPELAPEPARQEPTRAAEAATRKPGPVAEIPARRRRRRRARPEPAAEPVPTPPASEPEPAATVPEPEPTVPEPEPEPTVPEPEPIVPVPEPEPIVPEPEPVVPEPEPEPVVPEPEPEPEPLAVAPSLKPVAATAEPTIEPADEPAAASTEPEPEPEPDVVVVPELQPAERSARNESASEVLDRLVEPVGSHELSEEATNLRARLARTAAIKKPGSKERRELDEQQHRT